MSKFGVPSYGRDPLAYMDSRLSGVPTVEGPRDPTVNDHYPIQTVWRNSVNFRECMLVGYTSGQAIWSCFTDADGTVLNLDVDFDTAPGTDPVTPTATGQVSILGNTVVNATNLDSPVATHSRADNQFHVDVQLATTVDAAPADPFDVGLSSYATADFGIDGNGHATLNPILRNKKGYYTNLGVNYAAGTGVFTVQGAKTTLSATNPGYVTFASQTTPGTTVTVPITTDQAFIDDVGASEIIDNLFGFTTGVAIVVNVPFFIYAVLNDDEDAVSFMICRQPGRGLSPTSANIGVPGTPGANDESEYFSFDAITTTEWDVNPCVLVGSMRMKMSASDDWTVTTPGAQEGIGSFLEEVLFDQPLGQFGADAGTLCIANGGTAAVFSTYNGRYMVTKNGYCYYRTFINADGGTDGAGAVAAQFTMPFNAKNTGLINTTGLIRLTIAGGTGGVTIGNNNGANKFQIYLEGDMSTPVHWAAFSAGARTVPLMMYYSILN